MHRLSQISFSCDITKSWRFGGLTITNYNRTYFRGKHLKFDFVRRKILFVVLLLWDRDVSSCFGRVFKRLAKGIFWVRRRPDDYLVTPL